MWWWMIGLSGDMENTNSVVNLIHYYNFFVSSSAPWTSSCRCRILRLPFMVRRPDPAFELNFVLALS